MTEFVNNMPDCLVFKFEEVEADTEKIDNTVIKTTPSIKFK